MGKLGRTERILAQRTADLKKAMLAYMDYHRAVQVLVFEPESEEADRIRDTVRKSKETPKQIEDDTSE